MDRLKFIILSMLALSGCSKISDIETLGPEEIYVSVVDAENETKSSLSGTSKTKFGSGDKIKVYDTAGKSAVFKFQSVSGDDAKFIMDTGDDGFSIDNFEAAFYPANIVTAYASKQFTATIPDAQAYASGSFGNGAAPMISRTISGTTDKTITFSNCFGIVKMGFVYETSSPSLTVSKLSVTSASTKLTGDFTFSISDGGVVSVGYPASGGGNVVTLNNCNTAGELSGTAKYFFVALPPIAATTAGEKLSIEVTPTTGVPFGGYFMASKGTSSTANKVAVNNILTMNPFKITPVNSFSEYSVADWTYDYTMKVGQITVSESLYKIGTAASSIDVQINGATDLTKLTATVKSGSFTASCKEEGTGDDKKFYVTITKNGATTGSTGKILVNDQASNSGVYVNVKVSD